MPTEPRGDLIAVAAIIVGFGLTVIMFRVQRELDVQENRPKWPTWLAWSDYLIIVSVALALCFAIIPLLALPPLTRLTEALASAACVGAVILQAGYIPGILAHYRIEIGSDRKGDRDKGEPAEKWIVRVSFTVAAIGIIFAFCQHWR